MIDKITINGVTYNVTPTTAPQLGDQVVTIDGVIYIIGEPLVEAQNVSGGIERARVGGQKYDLRDAVIQPIVQKLQQRVIDVLWTSKSKMNDLVIAGVYNIKGERTMYPSYDNLPIYNRGSGHTISARLEVLDSSINDTTNSDDKCITQKLTLSNRVGGDGNVYIRTGRGRTYGSITWEPWATLQPNINVGEVRSLDNFVDNAIYSGVWTDNFSSFAETFVMITINDYAVAGDDKTVVQIKYAYDTFSGNGVPTFTTRSLRNETWGGWMSIGVGADTRIAQIEERLTQLESRL